MNYCDCCGQAFECDWNFCRNGNLCPECSKLLDEDQMYYDDTVDSLLLEVGEYITDNEFDYLLTERILEKEI